MGIIGSAFVGLNRVYGAGEDRLPPGLLDLYPGAAAAWSVRRLSNTYTGACVQVVRSGDNTTLDIGFDENGVLDVAAAQTFVVAGGGTQNGTITWWYDQSGNGYNGSQGAINNQPTIISGGSIITQGSKPAIDFDGNDLLGTSLPYTPDPSTDKTIFNVYYPRVIGASIVNYEIDGSIAQYAGGYVTTEPSIIFNNNISYVTTGGTINTYSLSEMWQDGVDITDANDFKLYLNGTYLPRESGGAASTVRSSQGSFRIGEAKTNYFDGLHQEIISYPSALSDTDREGIRDNINNYYSIY